jgi:hypothetical protein
VPAELAHLAEGRFSLTGRGRYVLIECGLFVGDVSIVQAVTPRIFMFCIRAAGVHFPELRSGLSLFNFLLLTFLSCRYLLLRIEI